jgi:hypothetical protein
MFDSRRRAVPDARKAPTVLAIAVLVVLVVAMVLGLGPDPLRPSAQALGGFGRGEQMIRTLVQVLPDALDQERSKPTSDHVS